MSNQVSILVVGRSDPFFHQASGCKKLFESLKMTGFASTFICATAEYVVRYLKHWKIANISG